MTLPSFTKLFATVFANGANVVKADARQWGLEVETALNALFSRTPIINGAFIASVDSNVLTVALKTLAGADPSSTDPVYVDFRHATQTNGQSAVLRITAACSITVSAGATLGFTNGVHGRLWVVLFNDAGTPRLGVFNAYGGAGGVIHPLYPSLVASSTDEAGDGSADSAGVIYTDTAVSSKAFVVLGHMTWETALATAGNWSAVPNVVHQQRWGDRLPGDLVQRRVQRTATSATGTTATPADNTIPQVGEGVEFMAVTITPKSKANVLDIEHNAFYAHSAATKITAALHQDDSADAIAATGVTNTAAGDIHVVRLMYRMLAATVSATEFELRAGGATGSTLTFLGSAGAGFYNGVGYGMLEAVERMA